MVRRVAVSLVVLAACVGDDPSPSNPSSDGGTTPDSGIGTPPGDSGGGDTSATNDGGDAAKPCLAQDLTGMISWWTGDDTLDDRRSANNMTSIGDGGTIGFVPGHVGKALSFPGTAHLERAVPDGFNGISKISVEAWVKLDEPANMRILERVTAGDPNGWLFDVYVGYLRIAAGIANASSTVPMPIGVVTHVAGTFDGTTARVYIDGVEKGAAVADASVAIPQPAHPLRIGIDSAGTSVFKGFIDELAVYSRVLTAAEIKAIFDAGQNGRCKQ